MEINFFAVMLSSIVAMVIGAIWYGPLFGKKWMEIIGADGVGPEKHKEMQKAAMPMYAIQFALTFFQASVLAYLMHLIDPEASIGITVMVWSSATLIIWAAFVVPIIAAGAMWNNDSRRIALSRFFIQSGYQFVIFLMFAIILGLWR